MAFALAQQQQTMRQVGPPRVPIPSLSFRPTTAALSVEALAVEMGPATLPTPLRGRGASTPTIFDMQHYQAFVPPFQCSTCP
jgi:hypothetical protein